jgi:methylase of polypeptide subunit release factors
VSFVALELGAGQAPAVTELLRAAGFAKVECMHDLAGMERVVKGERLPIEESARQESAREESARR